MKREREGGGGGGGEFSYEKQTEPNFKHLYASEYGTLHMFLLKIIMDGTLVKDVKI